MARNQRIRLTSMVSICSLLLFILFTVTPVSARPVEPTDLIRNTRDVTPYATYDFELGEVPIDLEPDDSDEPNELDEPANTTVDLEPVDIATDLEKADEPMDTEPFEKPSHVNPGAYQYGDVIRRLYGPDVELLKGKKLDAVDVCSSDLVNPLTVEGWHYSGAGSFIRQWVEASRKTPGFEVHAEKQGFDFRSKFLNDVLQGINPPKCHIHTPCVPLDCKDIVENLIVPDPAIAMAVMYTDKHMVDFLAVADAQLKLFDHAELDLKFSANDIVKRFTWREDDSIAAHCMEIADKWMTAIQTVVIAIGSLAGTSGTIIAPVAGSVIKAATQEINMGARQMGTTLARQIGPSAPLVSGATREAQALISTSNAVGVAAKPVIGPAGQKILDAQSKSRNERLSAYVTENAWGIAPAAVNNLILKPKLSGLAAAICKGIPSAAKGSDDTHYEALFSRIKDLFSEYRRNTEHETLRIKDDRALGEIGKWAMVDYLEAGSFFLNSAAEAYFLDDQEDSRKRLTDYMQSLFAISTMKTDGSGVHCTWVPAGCDSTRESIADDTYCVEKDVVCQAFSWLEFNKHQFKVPHWGSTFLNYQGGSQMYGFNTKKLVEKSWAYYKNKAFEPGWQGDLMNDAYQLMGEEFDKGTPVHLPVCFDPEGYYQLTGLGYDPAVQHKVRHDGVEYVASAPPCSCGFSGEETESFLRASGLFRENSLREISSQCYSGAKDRKRSSFHYDIGSGNLDQYWSHGDRLKYPDPFQTYSSHCTMTSILENFASESGTKPIQLIKGHGQDKNCAEIRALHKKLMLEKGLNSMDATCEIFTDEVFIRTISNNVLGDKGAKLADQSRDYIAKVCGKKPISATQMIDPSYLPRNLKTDFEVPVDILQPPMSIKDVEPKHFACHVPKPWLKEKLPQKCIDMTAEFYKGRTLPKVNQYGFTEKTERSEFAVIPKDGGVRE